MTATPTVVLPPIALGDPAQLDLTAYRGDTGRFRVLVTQDGAPLDVSAATWDCDIRATPDGPAVAAMTVTPVAGQTNAVDVELVATGSATMASGEHVWDLEMTLGTDPDTTVTTLLRGAITITPDVSRPAFEPPPTGASSELATARLVASDPGPLAALGLELPPDPGPVVVHGIEDSDSGL